MSYTPGPWSVPARDGLPLVSANTNADGSPIEGSTKNGGIYIAKVQGPDADANARLIATGPMLLDELEKALDMLETFDGTAATCANIRKVITSARQENRHG